MNLANELVKLVCPHCGHETHINATEVGEEKPEMWLCFPEDGGCDEYFMARVQKTVTFHVQTAVLKFKKQETVIKEFEAAEQENS